MLEIKNMSFNITTDKKEVEILKNIDLKLLDNRIYAITGPNGGGKSSLAKILMGIFQPTSGQIWMDRCDITPLSITERAHLGIGYAFQQPPRFKGMKIKELLELAASENQDNTNTSDLLYEVGLSAGDYLDRNVDSNLSGGEMKRLEIATVFARNLKVAIFDEPEAGIDLWSLQELAETFRNMHAQYDTTIVIISHQEKILELADEIILMTDGEIKGAAEKDKILSQIFHSDSCFYQTHCGREGWPQC